MPVNSIKIILFITSILWVVNGSVGEVYKWVDEQGKTHFSDQKPDEHDVEKLEFQINTYTNVTFEDAFYDSGKKVVMYSTHWCGYCKKARKYFKRNKIPYTEYDIEKNNKARKRYNKMGARGVPVIIVGKKQMNGFTVKGFERIYK